MIHKTIIDRAMRIVRSKLEDIDSDDGFANISKTELIHISTALAIASVLCRVNKDGGDTK